MALIHRLGASVLLAAAAAALAEAPAEGPATTLPVAQRETLYATLWVQRSAEFRFAAEQTYVAATEHLRRALLPGTAALEQEKQPGYAKLPPAIILDIDETVLDNAPYQGWAIQAGAPYDEADFRRWVAMKSAREIPGAAKFTRVAAKRGIKIFYVTNRGCDKPATATEPAVCPAKDETMENMAALGFARAKDPSAYLFLNEREGWVSDKTSRRSYLAQKYRIIMLLGDDLKDILPGDTVNALRKEADPDAYKKYLSHFGHRWFILPNPVYGSWDRVIKPGMEARYQALDAAPLGVPAKQR